MAHAGLLPVYPDPVGWETVADDCRSGMVGPFAPGRRGADSPFPFWKNSGMAQADADSEPLTDAARSTPASSLVMRSLLGGALMGLANLVPGISGGTMLLAVGIYPRFVQAIAELTRFRFRRQSLIVLACVVAAAGLAVLAMAGTLKELVVDHRWAMYSLFIGLTLGGIPVVWRLIGRVSGAMIVACVVAFLLMLGLAVLKWQGVVGHTKSGPGMMFLAGLAGASAMILPGVSGGYLLLLMGQYIPILSGIDRMQTAARAGDVAAIWDPVTHVVLPVGIGVVIGVVGAGNLLAWLMKRFRTATLGFLLGLLLGSVISLYPFQQGVKPKIGDVIKGETVTLQNRESFDPEDWPTEIYRPSAQRIAASGMLVLLGLATTIGIARMGRDPDDG